VLHFGIVPREGKHPHRCTVTKTDTDTCNNTLAHKWGMHLILHTPTYHLPAIRTILPNKWQCPVRLAAAALACRRLSIMHMVCHLALTHVIVLVKLSHTLHATCRRCSGHAHCAGKCAIQNKGTLWCPCLDTCNTCNTEQPALIHASSLRHLQLSGRGVLTPSVPGAPASYLRHPLQYCFTL
jgi:hypothetical protein